MDLFTRTAPPAATPPPHRAADRRRGEGLLETLRAFQEFGEATREQMTRAQTFSGQAIEVPALINEYWTARQRQASSLHEVSYRACFKPQLPRFFIEQLTEPGERVYDPFMGRGTTPVEAALLGRVPAGNDVNPLSLVMTRPRLAPPSLAEVAARLQRVDFDRPGEEPEDLLVFYHADTLRKISSLRRYLLERRASGSFDLLDEWISLVALNRLTGHSNGFFSVYTLPPNQAVSVKSQRRINEKRKQVPTPREVPALILKKTRQLLGDVSVEVRRTLAGVAEQATLLTGPAEATPSLPDASVALVVTSPPFLDVVQYATDNWLRCWFLGFDSAGVQITVPGQVDRWQEVMTRVLRELFRVVRPGGHVAFEVGEVHQGKTRLEEAVLPCAVEAGFTPLVVVINDQEFTKTANCWGVDNMARGTNTNRIVVLRKG